MRWDEAFCAASEKRAASQGATERRRVDAVHARTRRRHARGARLPRVAAPAVSAEILATAFDVVADSFGSSEAPAPSGLGQAVSQELSTTIAANTERVLAALLAPKEAPDMPTICRAAS